MLMFLALLTCALLQNGEARDSCDHDRGSNNPRHGDCQCVTREEMQAKLHQLLSNIEPLCNVAISRSCRELPPNSLSGYYSIRNSTGHINQEYCDMTRRCCNITGGWMRVTNLNMTDPNQQCPPGLRLVTSPIRTCWRESQTQSCVTVGVYPTHGHEYSRVCGRARAYQYDSPNAFLISNSGTRTVEETYVAGISLTHGRSPRKHIWTFAAARDETVASYSSNSGCPCTRPDLGFTGTVPAFVGQDYFCETGSRGTFQNAFHSEDPLWDGEGCGPQSTCCSFNSPPWFCKQLPQPTTDDIEIRLCADSREDVPLERVEIYVQ